jgi:hypothetical protein
MFVLNLAEIGIYFAIAYLVLGAFPGRPSAWATVTSNIAAVFGLRSVASEASLGAGPFLAGCQRVLSWTLVVLVIGNVVGAIRRGEEQDGDAT